MSNSSKTLLMIRPQHQAEEFVSELNTDVPVVFAPVVEIESLDIDLPNDLPEPFLFTSANAVRSLAEISQPTGQHAICAGSRTAEIAKDAGYNVELADGLAGELAKHVTSKSVTYIRGEQVSVDLVQLLAGQGTEVRELILYRQARKRLNEQVIELIETKAVIVPVFSCYAATCLIEELTGTTPMDLRIAAISENVGNCFPVQYSVEVAKTSDRSGMRHLIQKMI